MKILQLSLFVLALLFTACQSNQEQTSATSNQLAMEIAELDSVPYGTSFDLTATSINVKGKTLKATVAALLGMEEKFLQVAGSAATNPILSFSATEEKGLTAQDVLLSLGEKYHFQVVKENAPQRAWVLSLFDEERLKRNLHKEVEGRLAEERTGSQGINLLNYSVTDFANKIQGDFQGKIVNKVEVSGKYDFVITESGKTKMIGVLAEQYGLSLGIDNVEMESSILQF